MIEVNTDQKPIEVKANQFAEKEPNKPLAKSLSIPDPNSSYYRARMDLLGVTSDNNKIALWQNDLKTGKPVKVDFPIFSEVPEGIKIIVYTLDRLQIRIAGKETIDPVTGHGKINGNRWKRDFAIIRLEKPVIRPDGSTMKYRLPKGGGTYPFFPPSLLDKFEKKTPIDTLFLTEGYFKAFKASMCEIDIIGLSSITHMKDKETGKLHPDIIRMIEACSVKKMVWLTDGDALDITQQEISEAADLTKRPKNFFNSVTTFKSLLDDFEEIEKWYFHIDTDNILLQNSVKIKREDVKGLDDLLISLPKKNKEILADLKSVNPGSYFQKFNVTYGTNKVYHHFHLRDVNDFFLFHVERRPELKEAEFICNGTKWKYNEETGQCDVKIPGNAKLYFRCGNDYYKFVQKPNKHGNKERIIAGRTKSTISDDHGKNFIKYVPKYETFCNVPDHFNFQQIINNCFNVYSPLDFLPDEELSNEGDCPTIINFLKHIFGEKIASYIDPVTKEKREFKNIDIALDYLQILYQKPWEKLPIICLVSRENNTGKSTFAKFLRLMLGANVAIVGNADLANDFNSHWAGKCVVICDETKIDKQHVVEKLKSLSTSDKIFLNEKGRAQVELDCFMKFILISNNEDNFIYASNEDIRYWIIKVPILKSENPEIEVLFKEEMSAFLSFLNSRKLATEKKNRMWFHPHLLKTEALKKVIAQSKSGLEKTLRIIFRDLFISSGEKDELRMSLKNIIEVAKLPESKYQPWYVEKCLKEEIGLSIIQRYIVEGEAKRYKEFRDAKAAALKKFPGFEEKEIAAKIKSVNANSTYKYYCYNYDLETKENKLTTRSDNGKAYILRRKDFVLDDDEIDSELEQDEEDDMEKEDDLPF